MGVQGLGGVLPLELIQLMHNHRTFNIQLLQGGGSTQGLGLVASFSWKCSQRPTKNKTC